MSSDFLGSLTSAVDLSSVTDRDHGNDKEPIIDCVDESIVADPNSPPGTAVQLARGWGARVLCEESDGAPESIASLRFNLAKLTYSGRSELDSVVAHVQPRSCFTCSHGMLSPSSDIAASKAEMSPISSSASIISS